MCIYYMWVPEREIRQIYEMYTTRKKHMEIREWDKHVHVYPDSLLVFVADE